MQEPLFKLERGVKARGSISPVHTHGEAQLTFARSGMVQVVTEAGRWLVPAQLGVWIPAGLPHHAEVLTDAELWVVHCALPAARNAGMAAQLDRAFALRITPLMRALLDAAFAPGVSADKAELVIKLMLHELTEAAQAPTFLPLPTGATARRVADVVFGDVRNQLGAEQIAARAATSVRTLSRVFQSETGLSFKLWRQRARIVQAMDRLSRGKPVAQVAAEVGFASVASFSCAFRQVTNMTPTSFVGQPGSGPTSMPS